MDNEIDHCIICNIREPRNEFNLSNRLSSRLKYVTDILPDLSEIGSLVRSLVGESTPADSPKISNDEDHTPETKMVVTPPESPPPSATSSSSSSSSSDTESLYESEEGTISAIVSPLQHGTGMPLAVASSLETFYVLKLVFQHPLEHVTTEAMMLLVQSPSDWFEICPSCRFLVCEGIDVVNALREGGNKDKIEHELMTEKLESNLYHLRSKFVSSMFQRICLLSWEFLDLEDFSDVTTINFLKTEAEAVLSFRHILLTTALQRVINLVNTSQLPLPIEDSIMEFSYSPAYSPEILIDSDSPDEDQSEHLDDLNDEIGLPDWFADLEEELDDEIFCDCLQY